MTLDSIRLALTRIRDFADGGLFPQATQAERELDIDFVAWVAKGTFNSSDLWHMAVEILKVRDIDFPRGNQ
jgi:hypothetical protein